MGRVLLSLFLFLSLALPVFAVDYTSDANCQGAWLIEEGEGTSVADDSQNTNNLGFAGDPTWATATPAAAYSTSYLSFDGDDRLSASYDASLAPTGALSLVTWARRPAKDVDDGLIGFGERNSNGYMLRWYSNNAVLIYLLGEDGGAWHNATIGADDVATWVHFVFCYDGAVDGVATAYKNGVEAKGGDNLSGDGLIVYDNDETFYLAYSQAGQGAYFTGDMDESAVFSDIITLTEASDIYDNGLYEASAAAGQVIMIF